MMLVSASSIMELIVGVLITKHSWRVGGRLTRTIEVGLVPQVQLTMSGTINSDLIYMVHPMQPYIQSSMLRDFTTMKSQQQLTVLKPEFSVNSSSLKISTSA